MTMPTCRHCRRDIRPDDVSLYMGGQDWTKWVHDPRHYYCFPTQTGGPMAEPEDWEKARDMWIGPDA